MCPHKYVTMAVRLSNNKVRNYGSKAVKQQSIDEALL